MIPARSRPRRPGRPGAAAAPGPRRAPIRRRLPGRRRSRTAGPACTGPGRPPPRARWRAFHRAQEQSVRLDHLAGARDGGGGECGGGGVGVRQHGGGGVQPAQVHAGLGDQRRLVEQFFQVLPELAVVEPDDEPQPGIEAPCHQGGPNVRLVVLVDERQRGGPGHPGGGQCLLVGHGSLQYAQFPYGGLPCGGPFPGGRTVPGGREPSQQAPARAGPRPPGSGPYLADGRHDQGHPLLVHVAEFGGQPVGEAVVTAHDHQVGGVGLLGARGRRGHRPSMPCRTAGRGVVPSGRSRVGADRVSG